MSETRIPRWAAFASVAAVAIATFANSIVNGFAVDDNYIIGSNGRVHQLADQAAIWLTPYWPTFGETLGLYRPLAIFGYAVQWAIGDGAPWVFHATSIAMHAAVSLLVLALLLRLASPGAALIGALLFAVHPLHTEVVANVVGQAEMIAAACVIAACIVYVDRPGQEAGVRRSLLIVALFLTGMLAKEGAVVLPGLLVALDFATGRVRPVRASLKGWLLTAMRPMLFLAAGLAAYFTLRLHVLGSIGGADAAPHLPFLRHGHRFLSALRAWPEYLRLLLFPVDLVADYSPGVVLPVESLSPMVIAGALMLLVTIALAIATPWLRQAGLPAAWFFIALFPVSNLVLPIGVLLAERILYLPSVGLSVAVAFAARRFADVADRRHVRLATAVTAACLLAMAVRSAIRNPDWKSTDAFWDAIVRDHPESYRSQSVNAWRMLQAGNLDLARGYYELANRIWPYDAVLLNNLAGINIELGRYQDAIPVLERSRELSDLLGSTEQMLAFAYLSVGQPGPALDAVHRADRFDVDPVLRNALRAQAYAGLGRHEYASAALRNVIGTAKGDTPDFRMLLARELARAGLVDLALAAADTALARTQPGTPIRTAIERLHTAIGRGCYDPASHSTAPDLPQPCADPLAGWPVVLPPGAQEVANPLQNATGREAAEPGDDRTAVAPKR
jgi:tetratricopeptide (TPR) repeat protein